MGLGIIFAGCGGTFWTATPLLSALLKRIRPDRVVFVDPDCIEAKNLQRQWVNAEVDESKVCLGARAVLGREDGLMYMSHFPQCTIDHPECLYMLAEMDTIVVTNVDNNQGRLDIRKWCKKRPGFSGMIVSGCDREYGQVFSGAWKDGLTMHDWLPSHPDMENLGAGGDACGQNIMSNAQTGVFLGWALQDMMDLYMNGGGTIKEYYWKRKSEDGSVRSWTEVLEVKEVAHVV